MQFAYLSISLSTTNIPMIEKRNQTVAFVDQVCTTVRLHRISRALLMDVSLIAVGGLKNDTSLQMDDALE
jgi:hypothetical protein